MLDSKSDWWSLGMIALEAATGRHPFEAPVGDSGWVTASVVDPFGNILGITYNPHFVAIRERVGAFEAPEVGGDHFRYELSGVGTSGATYQILSVDNEGSHYTRRTSVTTAAAIFRLVREGAAAMTTSLPTASFTRR